MVMDTLQIRLSKGILEKIDELVKEGIYANRSDFVREAVRIRVLAISKKPQIAKKIEPVERYHL